MGVLGACMTPFATVSGALLLEAGLGYPDRLFRAIGHPVTWFGGLIDRLERLLNHGSAVRRRFAGAVALLGLLAASIVPAAVLQMALGWGAIAVASPFLAQRSLYYHVAAVRRGLQGGGLDGGRAAVAHIVGRNPQTLDQAGVLRAAIESLAENFSDGVVAPAFWCAVAGLPGLAAYKAVNTADSMVGHRTPRHAAYGWAAARFDDLVNLPASRLAAGWLVLAACLHRSASPRGAVRAVLRDAGRHRSPNAGWPEAAMAGALGLRLAGPRTYGQVRVEDAWMGDGRADVCPADLDRALALYRTACALQILAAVALWATARG